MTLELLHQECAQGMVAERPAFEPIGRERRALALENGRGGRGEPIHWNLVGIVMPAAEIVFGKAGPFCRRRRQSGSQQGCEIERCHGYRLYAPSCPDLFRASTSVAS